MAQQKTQYCCDECGYTSPRWLGRCPSCQNYNTFTEEQPPETRQTAVRSKTVFPGPVEVQPLSAISPTSGQSRMVTGLGELDRVLSGGIVEGSLVLVGGDPGIGKSTMLLQICEGIGGMGHTILYVSGEESLQQIKLRAQRLGIQTEKLFLLSETDVTAIEQAVSKLLPQLVIIDSIQTMYNPLHAGVPGSVGQVRECTAAFLKMAKGLNISVILVGHVTKEGNLAGPRLLEHMVDTVLYFEGERRQAYRLIRAVKNRFGATDEIGVFEMNDTGLSEIKNPSEYMLNGRPKGVPGSVVTCSIEGTRPIMAEVQALVCNTSFGMPRRTATGLDYNRVVMLMAVLEKRAGLQLGNYDSYVNIAGGMKIAEPAMDAAVALAVAGSFRNKGADPDTVVFGEIGLTGEIRGVTMADKRVGEAQKLGFRQCVLPQANLKGLKVPPGIEVYGAANISELLSVALLS